MVKKYSLISLAALLLGNFSIASAAVISQAGYDWSSLSFQSRPSLGSSIQVVSVNPANTSVYSKMSYNDGQNVQIYNDSDSGIGYADVSSTLSLGSSVNTYAQTSDNALSTYATCDTAAPNNSSYYAESEAQRSFDITINGSGYVDIMMDWSWYLQGSYSSYENLAHVSVGMQASEYSASGGLLPPSYDKSQQWYNGTGSSTQNGTFLLDIFHDGDVATTYQFTALIKSSVHSSSLQTVPLPAAFWLFNSGILTFLLIFRNKTRRA